MLAALQVQHLTRVDFSTSRDARYPVTDSWALSKALARLSNLQQLHLGHNTDTSLGEALTTLVQLPHLTLLDCNGQWLDRSMGLQQLLAQPLPLRSLQLPVDVSYQLPVLNMALLTNLTELSTGSCALAEASVLPTQLQRLHIHSCAGAQSMAPLTRLELKQLQHLSVRVDFQQPQLLLQLAQLPAVTHLALQYDENVDQPAAAAATASAWPLLPQLRELKAAHGDPPSQPEWAAILAGVAAAAGLTKLTLDARMISDEFAEQLNLAGYELEDRDETFFGAEVSLCASLAKLTCLQDLTLAGGADVLKLNLLRGDALALTALTRLTRLVVARVRHGVGTTVSTALACSLPQLQSLDLSYCCLRLGTAEGFACLQAIGRLTQLTWLSIKGNEGLTQHGLMQLTGLSRVNQAGCEIHV
jgi:Leucine-rich repeat (LRR) protein